jgi:Tfp pilus assembly protein PilN
LELFVTRFDYLHDAPPDIVDRIRTYRLPRRLRSAAITLGVLACVLLTMTAVERARIGAAIALERQASGHVEAQRAALARAQLQWRDVDRLIAADRQLRRIRLSGSVISARLAAIANELPRRVWLSSIAPAASGWSIQGDALDVPALDTALANLIATPSLGNPRLVRMTSQARLAAAPVVSFEVRVGTVP